MEDNQPSNEKTYQVTEHGSLGLLALGHIGIRLWKKAIKEAKEKREKQS